MTARIVVLAKSPWHPAVRREHGLARAAAADGVPVTFVEPPADVRVPLAARADRAAVAAWGLQLRTPAREAAEDGITVLRRSAPAPGHRGRPALAADVALLGRQLRAELRLWGDAVLVVQLPWQWAATAGLGMRRVFDAADDWTALIPARARAIGAQYARIAGEADRVVVAQTGLSALFPGVRPVVVPNGVDAHAVAAVPAPVPAAHRMAYVGTLSERFDTAFVAGLLRRLPSWTLDLYGPCRYAGRGERPGDDLLELLREFPRRVRLHGPVGRDRVGKVVDGADVLLVPNRSDRGRGQSSMKLLDYAARGRPVVTTRWDDDVERQAPPGTSVVDTVEQAAAAVLAHTRESAALAAERVAWAGRRTWQQRWPAWCLAVTGSPAPSPAGGPDATSERWVIHR